MRLMLVWPFVLLIAAWMESLPLVALGFLGVGVTSLTLRGGSDE